MTRQPRYLLLAQQLASDIARGKFPVETNLPPEKQLCEQYTVSRHTIREAIRQLQSMGLVATRQGVGTQVIATSPNDARGRFTSSFQSIESLVQFADETHLIIKQVDDIIADDELAQQLNCNPGRGFLAIEALRVYQADDKQPFIWLKAYVAAAYAGIRRQLDTPKGPISRMIESEYGIRIREIQQLITPIVAEGDVAHSLQLEPGTPALKIQRNYLSDANEVVEYAISIQAQAISTTLTYED